MQHQPKESFYEVLGVSSDASVREIRRAFLYLAQRCHPDLNSADPDADRQFKRIRHVYEVLHDPISRAAYDAHPHRFSLDEDQWETDDSLGVIVPEATVSPPFGSEHAANPFFATRGQRRFRPTRLPDRELLRENRLAAWSGAIAVALFAIIGWMAVDQAKGIRTNGQPNSVLTSDRGSTPQRAVNERAKELLKAEIAAMEAVRRAPAENPRDARVDLEIDQPKQSSWFADSYKPKLDDHAPAPGHLPSLEFAPEYHQSVTSSVQPWDDYRPPRDLKFGNEFHPPHLSSIPVTAERTLYIAPIVRQDLPIPSGIMPTGIPPLKSPTGSPIPSYPLDGATIGLTSLGSIPTVTSSGHSYVNTLPAAALNQAVGSPQHGAMPTGINRTSPAVAPPTMTLSIPTTAPAPSRINGPSRYPSSPFGTPNQLPARPAMRTIGVGTQGR